MPENELESFTEETDELSPAEVLPESIEEETAKTAEIEAEAETTQAPIPDDYELLCARERADREYDEFRSLFPEMSLSELPDSVRESIRSGVPLCAACALHELRRMRNAEAAAAVNAANSELSFALEKNTSHDGYFSPDEVRGMSPSEVRTNYKKIIESMNHWN